MNSTTTVNAIGVAAGLTNSPVASAAYFIQVGGTGIDFGNGFANALSTMAFNGSTVLDGSRLELTTGAANQGVARSSTRRSTSGRSQRISHSN